MGKQGHGRRLTDKERMEIIELTRQDPRIKHVELAARYKVNESTIRKWRLSANAEKIETRYGLGVEDVRDTRQRGQVVRNALFDTALYEWVSAMRSENVELPPSKVREQAKALSTEFDGMQDFKASSGWYYRFCRRYGLPCPPVGVAKRRGASGTSASDTSAPASALAASASQAPNDADGAAAPTELSANGEDQRVEVGAQEVDSSHGPVQEGGRDGARNSEYKREQESQRRTLEGLESEQATPTCELSNSSERVLGAPTTAPEGSTVTASPAKAARKLGVPRLRTRKRKHEVTVDSTEVVTEERVAHLVAQRTIESPARKPQPAAAAPSTPATSVLAAATSTSVMTPSVLSTRQEVIVHFQRHHKNLLSVSSGLRFIKHLARTSEEAEMYAVMDDETRIEYIKEFADKGDDGAPADVVGESVV